MNVNEILQTRLIAADRKERNDRRTDKRNNEDALNERVDKFLVRSFFAVIALLAVWAAFHIGKGQGWKQGWQDAHATLEDRI